MPPVHRIIIASAVTGLAEIVLGSIRRATRTIIITGVAGLSLGLSVWFGYNLYQKAESWLSGSAQTGWVSGSEIKFAKGLIILFPIIFYALIALMLKQAQMDRANDYKPQIKPTGKTGQLDVEICKSGNHR